MLAKVTTSLIGPEVELKVIKRLGVGMVTPAKSDSPSLAEIITQSPGKVWLVSVFFFLLSCHLHFCTPCHSFQTFQWSGD